MKNHRRLFMIVAVLLATFAMRTWVAASPVTPQRQQLEQFPKALSSWSLSSEPEIEESVQRVLKADDLLSRVYRREDGRAAELFMAYYAVQRAGEAMHSPKNCLPGSGWQPVKNDVVFLNGDSTRPVNRYIIEKNDERALVLYWYRAQGRTIASEYWGKFYLMWDALRTGRRDGAIVRVVVPVRKGEDVDAATAVALDLAGASEGHVASYLPN